MTNFDAQAISNAVVTFEEARHPPRPTGIIEDETQWRLRPSGSAATASGSRVIATRWRSLGERAREVTAETPIDCHVVGIALRSLDARLSVCGRTVLDGAAMAGALLVTAPAVRCHCVFRGPYDTLHLHVPNELIAECVREMTDRQAAEICSGFTSTCDPELERLGRTLLGAKDLAGSFGRLYVDCISTAIIVRLLVPADRATCFGATESGRACKMAAQASHRLYRGPSRRTREPCRCCFGNRPHTRILLRTVQSRHRPAAPRIPGPPTD